MKNIFSELVQPGNTCFFLVNMNLNDFDNYRRALADFSNDIVVRMIRGSKSKNTNGFFEEISAAMQFPLYFGGNWNAFFDCITDLEWIIGTTYLILVSSADELLVDEADDEFKVMINVLSRACNEWLEPNKYIPRNRKETAFHVVFQCTSENYYGYVEKIKSLHIDFTEL